MKKKHDKDVIYYEFILKQRDGEHQPWNVRYRCCSPDRFDYIEEEYMRVVNQDPHNRVLLINKLDINGEFIGVVR